MDLKNLQKSVIETLNAALYFLSGEVFYDTALKPFTPAV